ncbi:hypothetical protein [Anaeromicropila herbilytica]|uniref:Glycine zipper family protein n=1 Tax=Anaeromicropila herbilytica TaxID=2785025 RepID=A0A7R7EQ19_9FIRM|nr:hypothetical protein [Anaeromicropila herbilytica]BCN32701.1 hypothetical protein bsdtb5_39960 [Anaeromicropila herbilytica]
MKSVSVNNENNNDEKNIKACPECNDDQNTIHIKETEDTYMLFGMLIGLSIGLAVGQYLFNKGPIGMSIGMCVGMAIGSFIKVKK